jgi:hypothetical protein
MLYEKALKASWPEGANGDAFNFLNAARKQRFILAHLEARNRACSAIVAAPDGYYVTVEEPRRSLDANAAQWPILDAFAKQLQWQINGKAQFITAEDWKDILTCAFRREFPRVAQGLDGGMVILGQRTSKFGKKEFSDWLEFLNATAIDRGVVL